MTDTPNSWTITRARDALTKGEISAVDLTMACLTAIDAGDGLLRAVFERRGEPLVVRPTRLAAVESLYAITIHKAQGSQFPRIIVPVRHSRLLDRTLLYTAITRAQKASSRGSLRFSDSRMTLLSDCPSRYSIAMK